MIGLGTNVVVRYLTQDDRDQFREASALLQRLEQQQGSAHLSIITLCETVWVLARAYQIRRERIAETLDLLLATTLFSIEDKDQVRDAVELYRTGKGDFADYLLGIRARASGCTTVATFDVALHAHEDLFAAPSRADRASRKTTYGGASHPSRKP